LKTGKRTHLETRLTCVYLGSLRMGRTRCLRDFFARQSAHFAADTRLLIQHAAHPGDEAFEWYVPNIGICSASEAGSEAFPSPRRQSIFSTTRRNGNSDAWLDLQLNWTQVVPRSNVCWERRVYELCCSYIQRRAAVVCNKPTRVRLACFRYVRSCNGTRVMSVHVYPAARKCTIPLTR